MSEQSSIIIDQVGAQILLSRADLSTELRELLSDAQLIDYNTIQSVTDALSTMQTTIEAHDAKIESLSQEVETNGSNLLTLTDVVANEHATITALGDSVFSQGTLILHKIQENGESEFREVILPAFESVLSGFEQLKIDLESNSVEFDDQNNTFGIQLNNLEEKINSQVVIFSEQNMAYHNFLTDVIEVVNGILKSSAVMENKADVFQTQTNTLMGEISARLSMFESQSMTHMQQMNSTYNAWINNLTAVVSQLKAYSESAITVSTDTSAIIHNARAVVAEMESLLSTTGEFQIWLSTELDTLEDATSVVGSVVGSLAENLEIKEAQTELQEKLLSVETVNRSVESLSQLMSSIAATAKVIKQGSQDGRRGI